MANVPASNGPYDPTYVFSTTTGTFPSTVTSTATAGNWYPYGYPQTVQTAGTAQNLTSYYDWQTMQRQQQEWAHQQRLYEAHLEYMRRMYQYKDPEQLFKSPEPEQLETKALSAQDRERLREALPF